MPTLTDFIQDEPNLHFPNFTKFYTMVEDKKGTNPPKINDVKANLTILSQEETTKIMGGNKKQTPSCGATPPQ